MFLRGMARVPMNLFNVYAEMPKSHPQLMNYWSCFSVMFFVTVAGKGAEKFAMWPSSNNTKFYAALKDRQAQLDAQK